MEELTLNIQQSHEKEPKTSKRGLKRNSNYPLDTCSILIETTSSSALSCVAVCFLSKALGIISSI